MKQILFSLLFAATCITATAQSDNDTLPYLKYPVMPAFEILHMDSSTITNTAYAPKDRPVIFVFFSPDCEHCTITIRELLNNRQELNNAKIYLFTPLTFDKLKPVYDKLRLASYKDVVVGKEFRYFFYKFYSPVHVPYIAIYNKKKKLVSVYDGGTSLEQIVKDVNKD
ncbi:MAG: hypothetical protein R2800_11595 [Flavipsychrobacter sp.]